MIAGRNYTEEVVKVMKTLAIRLEDELHTQLVMLAQLEGHSLTDAIRASIVGYIESRRQAPELNAKAEAVLMEVEREANARRAAIATLFTTAEPSGSPESSTPSAQPKRSAGSSPKQ